MSTPSLPSQGELYLSKILKFFLTKDSSYKYKHKQGLRLGSLFHKPGPRECFFKYFSDLVKNVIAISLYIFLSGELVHSLG